MRISTKLNLFLLGVFLLFSAFTALSLHQNAKLAAGYNRVLAGPVHAADGARIMQVEFKKQVQEWKNILLRGHKSEDLAHYKRSFHRREAATRHAAKELLDTLDDLQAHQLVSEFIADHDKLSEEYESAYQAYLGGGFDFKAADAMVRGRDRHMTDVCDEVVKRLGTYVQQSVAEEQALSAREQSITLSISGLLLLIWGGGGVWVVVGIATRLNSLKAVLARLANADFTSLELNVMGHDEIGEFAESMAGVLAAFDELNIILNQHQSPRDTEDIGKAQWERN